MKVLVTGSCGQLGQSIMAASEGMSDVEFMFTDLVSEESSGVLALDITDRDAVFGIFESDKVDVVVNCAGYTDVERAESEEDKAFSINSEAVSNLADAAAAAGAVLIHISTDYVFDGTSSSAYGEDAEPAPLSAYGRSKLAGELAVLASGCPYMIIRTSWMFSRYGKNFVKTILNKTASQPSIKVVCDQIGTPTYAGDLAEFILGLIEDGNLDRSGIYNFTNEGVCSWYDLAWEVCDISGNLCEVLPCRTEDYPVKAVRPAFSVLDKSKVKSVFGVGIPHWKDSLRFCLSQM